MPGVLGADKRISSSQGDGGPENRGELECLSLSLPAHPASRGSRLVNNLIFLLQLKYKDSKPPSSKWKREEEQDRRRIGVGAGGGAVQDRGEADRKGLTSQTFLLPASPLGLETSELPPHPCRPMGDTA